MDAANTNSIINIKEFINRHSGLQRPNRYSVQFNNLPEQLQPPDPSDIKVGSVTIGARAIDGIADGLAGYGAGRTIPRSQKFPQGILLTFPVTNDHFITSFFDRWFNALYSGGRQRGNLATAFQVGFYDQLVSQTQMVVNLLDLNGNPNATFTFYEIYPIETLPIELAMAKNNEFSTYSVLLLYRDFTFTKRI